MVPVLLKIKDIQRILGCGHTFAYELMHSKDFPAIKIKGTYYVKETDFVLYVEQNRITN